MCPCEIDARYRKSEDRTYVNRNEPQPGAGAGCQRQVAGVPGVLSVLGSLGFDVHRLTVQLSVLNLNKYQNGMENNLRRSTVQPEA